MTRTFAPTVREVESVVVEPFTVVPEKPPVLTTVDPTVRAVGLNVDVAVEFATICCVAEMVVFTVEFPKKSADVFTVAFAPTVTDVVEVREVPLTFPVAVTLAP